jgi:hypothetical protein
MNNKMVARQLVKLAKSIEGVDSVDDIKLLLNFIKDLDRLKLKIGKNMVHSGREMSDVREMEKNMDMAQYNLSDAITIIEG